MYHYSIIFTILLNALSDYVKLYNLAIREIGFIPDYVGKLDGTYIYTSPDDNKMYYKETKKNNRIVKKEVEQLNLEYDLTVSDRIVRGLAELDSLMKFFNGDWIEMLLPDYLTREEFLNKANELAHNNKYISDFGNFLNPK